MDPGFRRDDGCAVTSHQAAAIFTNMPAPRSSSAADSIRELNRAISSGNFEPVYLFDGEEEYLKETKARQLIDAALDPSSRDFNLDVRQGSELSAMQLDSLLSTPPMLAQRRVVLIKEISGLKKAARTVLEKYLEKPARDVLLVMTEPGTLAKGEASIAECSTTVRCEPLDRNALDKWIERYAANSFSAKITPDATALLVEAVGSNLGQLASELDKLGSYSSEGVIEVEAVEDLVGVRRGETLADLLDAIAMRETDRTLSLLRHTMAQPRTNGVQILLSLTTQMLGIAYARAMMDEGRAGSTLSKEMFGFLSAGKGFTARPWGDAVRVWTRAAEKWTMPELNLALRLMLETDMMLKESRASSDEHVLESLLLQMLAPRQAVAA